MKVRLSKVLRDLSRERGRAALVLLALTIGGWGVASVVASTSVLLREIRDNFLVTRPAHAILTLRSTGDGDAVTVAAAASWVTAAERRTRIGARARGGFDGRLPAVLFLVEDFERQHLAKVELETGRWPGPGEIALERDDLTVLGLDEAPASVEVQLPGGPWIDIPVSGVVHDPGQAPARMEHILYFYSPPQTAQRLGADLEEQHVIVRLAPPAVTSRELAQAHAELLGDELADSGFEVLGISVPDPDEHPHEGQMRSFLFLQLVFGGLAMLLGGVVVVHMISSLMQRQIAQVGVLKALGGTPAQVAQMYLLTVLLVSLAALVLTLPLGLGTGLHYADFVVRQLNFDLLSPGVPFVGWLLILGALLTLPQLAAAFPVGRGIQVRVREALMPAGGGKGVHPLARVRSLPIAVRNVARRPGRVALTVLSLAIGLASLAASFHVGASLRATMVFAFESRPYDLIMSFHEPVERDDLAAVLDRLDPPLAEWHGLAGGRARRVTDDGRAGDPFTVIVGEPLEPRAAVIAGEWRLPPEGRGLVVSARFAVAEGLAVGDIVTLRLDGGDSRWPVAAIARSIGGSSVYLLSSEPLSFTGLRAASATLPPPSREELEAASATPLRLPHGAVRAPALSTAIASYQAAAARRVEAVLEDAGIALRMGTTKAEIVAGLEDHVYIMTRLLAIASLVILAVAGLGLAAAMSVSVLERTREIGVLRSLGATPATLARIFAAEAGVISVLGLAVGFVMSFPLGRAISDFFGLMMFATPLDEGTSLSGLGYGAAVTVGLVLLVTAAVLVQTLRQPTTAALRHE